jgi:hypothetical protein
MRKNGLDELYFFLYSARCHKIPLVERTSEIRKSWYDLHRSLNHILKTKTTISDFIDDMDESGDILACSLLDEYIFDNLSTLLERETGSPRTSEMSSGSSQFESSSSSSNILSFSSTLSTPVNEPLSSTPVVEHIDQEAFDKQPSVKFIRFRYKKRLFFWVLTKPQ